MSDIKIFQSEINDGLSDLVKSTASIAYVSEPTLHVGNIDTAKKIIHNEDVVNKLVAENKDQKDLYYIESILVSTGINKNDDVFLPEHTWAARDTPEDKQFNYMHDENDIIGHITGSRILDKQGNAIGTEFYPEKEFDILTQAVLYNSWTNPENQERMNKIISEIKEDKWFVSMECLFAGFDYALSKDGETFDTIERNEASAFLTKHLRAYGGTGKYEDYKVCRILKNIAFSGKGLVSRPANPRSIILKTRACEINDKSTLNIGEVNMTVENSVLEKQLAEMKAELAEAKQAHEAAKAEIEEAKNKEFASKIEAYVKQLTEKDEALAEANKTVEELQTKATKLEEDLTEAKSELSKAAEDMEKMKKKEKEEKRKATLIEAGFNSEEAESIVASFEALDDKAFETVAVFMKKDDKKDKKDKKGEEADASEADVTPELTEDLEASEATLETDEADTADESRKAIASTIENLLSK